MASNRRMRRYVGLAFVIVALACLAATPATACRIRLPSAERSVIHSELPRNLPAGAVVADVELGSDDATWQRLNEGARVRIRRMIQGDYRGEALIVRELGLMITCYSPFPLGRSGFVVGKPVGYENGVLVIEPIWLPSR